MRVALTGSNGQLAAAMRAITPDGLAVEWLDRRALDITDALSVSHSQALARCDVLVNAAAYTAVDAAEDDAAGARAVNELAPGYLARRCAEEGVHLVQLSTDYVFGSTAPQRPLKPADPVAPDTVYGRTKLAGEQRVSELLGDDATILRTAWVYSGNTLPEHRDFVSTMLQLEAERDEVTVVNDQFGSPTYALDLARVVWHVVGEKPGGIRHAVGSGTATWFEVARAVFEEAGADPDRVKPITSAEYPARAPRPPWSVLESSYRLPEWRSAVARAVGAKL